LARLAFVGERDHIVVALIDMIEQAENDLKGLAYFGGVAPSRLFRTAVAVRNFCKMVHAV
jgi:hypothetical protein